MRRPICVVCLLLIFLMSLADFAGIPLIRGNPLPEKTVAYIRDHPDGTIGGEVIQCTDNEFSQSVYLSDAYLIYKSKKISIENVKVFLKKKETVPPGTFVLVSGKLQRVPECRNPGEFDSRQYYECQHIYYYLKNGKILKKSDSYSAYRQFLLNLKEKFNKVLRETAGKDAGTFQAIVLGDKGNLEEETKLRYQMAGIVHILAISGLHISIVGVGLYQLLMKTGLGIWGSGMLSLIVMLQYGMITGGSVSTMRAVCMFLLTVGAKITGRIYDMPTGLAVAAMLILGESGAYLYSNGFLMSFCAVLGIGVVFPSLQKLTGKKSRHHKKRFQQKWLRACKKNHSGSSKIQTALLSSLSVQLAMLPVLLYFYGEVSLAGIFLNLLVLPTAWIVLISGVITVLAGLIYIPAGILAAVPGKGLLFLYEKLCIVTAMLPFSNWIAGKPQLWQIWCYVGILCAVVWISRREGKRDSGKAGKRAAVFFLLAAGIWILSLHRTEEFSITCLDVGQGDGIVLETPEKYCFLVDGGSSGQKTVGKRQILPYLKCKGISRVDGILISHTDGDHISGIREILELSGKGLSTIEIGALYLPDWTEPPDAWLELKKLAHEAGISVFTLGEKQCLRAGRLSLEVLSPSKGSSGQDVNEDCMVLEVRYGEFLGLFTGDMGEETEKELLKENVLQDVDFLKVGHHGSRYSTCQEFLEKIKPEYSVISCSENNTYGHPSLETVERLENAGSQVVFTMKSGAVTIFTDGKNIHMEEYLKAAG